MSTFFSYQSRSVHALFGSGRDKVLGPLNRMRRIGNIGNFSSDVGWRSLTGLPDTYLRLEMLVQPAQVASSKENL